MKYRFSALFLFLIAAISFGYFQNAYAIAGSEESLGGLTLDAYCNHLNQVNSNPINSNDWQCNPSKTKIDMNLACQWQYNDPNAYGKQGDSNNPYTWQCISSAQPTPSISPTPTSSPGPTSPPLLNTTGLKVLDTQGSELGIFVSSGLNVNTPTVIFSPQINKFIPIDSSGTGERTIFRFLSSDCKGTPYLLWRTEDGKPTYLVYAKIRNKVFVVVRPNAVDIGSPTEFKSMLVSPGDISGNCTNQPSAISTQDLLASPTEEITLPFSLPIKLPLQFKYQ